MKKFFYRAVARLFGPRVVAKALFLFELQSQVNTEKPNVLVHSRRIFSKDIKNMKEAESIHYIVLSNGVLAAIQSVWIPKRARVQTFYYCELEKNAYQWSRCNRFAGEVLSLIRSHADLIGVLSANFDYWQDASFRHQCENSSLSFMVLRRENEVTKKAVSTSLERYKDVDVGTVDLAMVFSESSRKMMESIEAERLFFNKIVITGPPRLDKAQRELINRGSSKRNIVFFTYLNGNYCEDTRNFWDVLKVVYDVACVESKSIIIKCKSKEDHDILVNEFPRHCLNPNNVMWSVDDTTSQVVSDSVCAIAFNSTVLVELLALPIPLIIPFVNVSEEERNDAILHEVQGAETSGLFNAKSIDELKSAINVILHSTVNFNYEEKIRSILLERYVGWNPLIPSSKRVEQAILKYRKA